MFSWGYLESMNTIYRCFSAPRPSFSTSEHAVRVRATDTATSTYRHSSLPHLYSLRLSLIALLLRHSPRVCNHWSVEVNEATQKRALRGVIVAMLPRCSLLISMRQWAHLISDTSCWSSNRYSRLSRHWSFTVICVWAFDSKDNTVFWLTPTIRSCTWHCFHWFLRSSEIHKRPLWFQERSSMASGGFSSCLVFHALDGVPYIGMWKLHKKVQNWARVVSW